MFRRSLTGGHAKFDRSAHQSLSWANRLGQIQPRETLTKNRGQVLQMAQKTPAKKAHAEDPHYSQAVQNYEAGLKALHERVIHAVVATPGIRVVLDDLRGNAPRIVCHPAR